MTTCPSAIALLLAAAIALPATAADDDALDLQADPPPGADKSAATPGGKGARTPAGPGTGAATSSLRLALEAAGLQAVRSGGLGDQSGHRLAVDLRWSGPVGAGWRFNLSNRLDDLHPAQSDLPNTRNSLREAYLGWQSDTGTTGVEIGRQNLRHGPGLGYSPTDYFRSGATRVIVSADPVALRENRVGTFMLRASRLWDGGGATIAWAPKLTRRGPSDDSLTLDLGATNARSRVLMTVNGRLSGRWSGEVLALAEDDGRSRLGLNFTGLVSDWMVLHGELSGGRQPSLIDQVLGPSGNRDRVTQATLGTTFSLPRGLSVTAEASYNGAGLARDDWQRLFAAGTVAAATLLRSTQADQELAARRGWLLYATQKNVLVKQLDWTAFVRHNPLDHSSLAWAELRYHWPRFDTALQWQRGFGQPTTEFGALPYRRVVQLVGTLLF